MVGDGDAQAVVAVQRGVGGRCDPALLKLDQDRLVEAVQRFRIQPARVITETDDVQADGPRQFQLS